ncbi:MAG: PilZ domain-containing protein [Planctomycetota bacterium]|jgi:hypothetical protein
MTSLDRERRIYVRLATARPCKVLDPRSGRYVGGRTRDVSAGGVLVELDRRLPLEPGATLLVGVASHRQAIIRRESMTEGRVVRALTLTTGETTVAVRYDDAIAERALAA